MHTCLSSTLRKLDTIGQKVDDKLTVSQFIDIDWLKVVLVDRVGYHGSDQTHIFNACLSLKHAKTPLDQLCDVKVVFLHRERVVCHHCLVHQIAKKCHHHLGLGLHSNKFVIYFLSLLQHFVDHCNKIFAFNDNDSEVLLHLWEFAGTVQITGLYIIVILLRLVRVYFLLFDLARKMEAFAFFT